MCEFVCVREEYTQRKRMIDICLMCLVYMCISGVPRARTDPHMHHHRQFRCGEGVEAPENRAVAVYRIVAYNVKCIYIYIYNVLYNIIVLWVIICGSLRRIPLLPCFCCWPWPFCVRALRVVSSADSFYYEAMVPSVRVLLHLL